MSEGICLNQNKTEISQIRLKYDNKSRQMSKVSSIQNVSLNLQSAKEWKYSICDPGPQTSHKGQFFEIEIYYASSESWMNRLSIDVWFGRDTSFWKSGIWGCKKNLNIEKIVFKFV